MDIFFNNNTEALTKSDELTKVAMDGNKWEQEEDVNRSVPKNTGSIGCTCTVC